MRSLIREHDQALGALEPGAAEFCFRSPHGSVRASGMFQRITTAAAPDGAALQAQVTSALAEARAAGQSRPLVVGAIPFDTRTPSCLYVPQQVTRYARSDSRVRMAPISAGRLLVRRNLPEEARFKQAVGEAVAACRQGALDKVVLSRLLELEFDSAPQTAAVYSRLQQLNPEAYHFSLPLPCGGHLIGASPELLLRKQDNQFMSNPLAGSARRELEAVADRRVATQLVASAKDRHEHRLVIEQMQRQLAPLCRFLQVPSAPDLLPTTRLWHLSTRIEGELQAPLSALQLACQLHPTPALCGYPTAQARQLIAALEPFDRGLFGGIVGWADDQGNGEWVVVIRCGIISGRQVRLFAGAGLVEASCPQAEWAETGVKLGTMLNAFGLDTEATA
ncbi:isochorismate synthase [Halopseudomonas sabulinigri]|uniref:isochorismate synthase n=1 Tax=Halopseudomonas sabulinigri TaxID=472181 RepID=A0A1H1UFS5_9GAMM|nr:isochorismate synthase [Halopseudomonas sabulinigri]SDS71362.1 isochorismate synthase [Halopseudomonas sabulinigri]